MTAPEPKFLALELLFDGTHFGVPADDQSWHRAATEYPVVTFTRVINHVDPHVILRLKVALSGRAREMAVHDVLLRIVRDAPGLYDRFREYAHEVRSQARQSLVMPPQGLATVATEPEAQGLATVATDTEGSDNA